MGKNTKCILLAFYKIKYYYFRVDQGGRSREIRLANVNKQKQICDQDRPGAHDPVALCVCDVVVDGEHAVSLDLAVAADDAALE